MIIDAHVHVWPDAIARAALSGRVPGMTAIGDGTVAGLRESLRRTGVDRCVVMGIADQARHVDRANEFIGSLAGSDDGTFIPFGTIHPDLPVKENLASLRRYHIAGVKLHPLFQGFALDDPRIWALLEAFGADIPVIAHVGKGGSAEANTRSTPAMLASIVQAFPGLRLVACHFGGFHRLDEAEELLLGRPVMLETSWPPRLAALDSGRVRSIIERHGADRVVFGSDWPMADPAAEIASIRELGLSPSAETGVLGGNLGRFLGIGG
jgi:uncharacterized protein